jgi:hypothetical protein
MSAMRKMSEMESQYHDITELYTLADELLATVEISANPEAQLEAVAPLAEVLAESTDVLTDEYIGLAEGKPARKQAAKSKIETSLRRVYVAMNECGERVKDARNAAHAVIKKIKRQLETVISNFVSFTVLSLDRIMQKHDVEELKARHAGIALMLHQMSQSSF